MMRSFLPSALTIRAFTLVELLIALSLSLILLLAMTELFSRVGGMMNDTRATLNMTTNLDGVEYLLRQDLARIPKTLPTKPGKILDDNEEEVNDGDGYLEIVEGPDTILSHFYVNEDGTDPTVGDVDDIIGFTVGADPGIPFRGIIGGQIAERNAAEITWFVRGNTLYRRVRLIDDQRTDQEGVNSLEDLARRETRFGHDGAKDHAILGEFPYPLYDDSNKAWAYLRMPTLEETLHPDWDRDQWRIQSIDTTNGFTNNPDLWNQPYFLSSDVQDRKSGSLKRYSNPRNHRAGEDIVLTNVLSFDIKVWDSLTKDFVDLGTSDTDWTTSVQPPLPRTWDSWTRTYTRTEPDSSVVIEPPPFDKPMTAVRFTVRCFDPKSRGIKQISVVYRFDDP